MGTRQYEQFFNTPVWKTLLRNLVIYIVGLPVLIPIFFFPKDGGYHWVTKMMCKTVVPVTLGNFMLFAIGKWIALKLNLGNATVTTNNSGGGAE